MKTARVVKGCQWSPDGAALFTFLRGEILSAGDPRVAGGFFEVALTAGWIEPVGRSPSAPKNEAEPSPAREPDPKRRKAVKRSAPRTG